uniref:Uncharacterized protein n=1 Tax=Arundo donax TaxID=35708 RepID=A0A0A9HDC0_ARUDO
MGINDCDHLPPLIFYLSLHFLWVWEG